MSISIDLHICDKASLLSAFREWGATDEDLLVKIMSEFGLFTGDLYIILNNEYYSDNPYYGLPRLIDAAFGKEDSFDVLLDICYDKNVSSEGINYAEVGEIAERLGIVIPEDVDEDE